MAHIFHSSVNSFYSWQWLLFNWDRKCVIFQKDNKGFQTWTVTDAVWEESHLSFLTTLLGLSLMTQWLGIHLKAGVTGNAGLIPEVRRSSGGGNGNPLQYSCLENPMDREAWRATVHGVTKNWTRLKQLSMHTHISSRWFGIIDTHPASFYWVPSAGQARG